MSENLELATLGGGCFWCLEAVFENLQGVEKVVSGYAGGYQPDPTYREVCEGTTGHAEVVQLHYDPDVISYEELLEVFFDIHDPTTLNRQGADVGTQYRSIILHHNDEQMEKAKEMITELNASGRWPNPIVTQIAPLDAFYEAEDYHQEYYRNNPRQPYCRAVIAPKVTKFQQHFEPKLKTP